MKKFIFLLIIEIVILCSCNKQEIHTQTYVVTQGDTLWSIASEYCPKNIDKRDYIDELIKLNNIENCMIRANSSIQVIVYIN